MLNILMHEIRNVLRVAMETLAFMQNIQWYLGNCLFGNDFNQDLIRKLFSEHLSTIWRCVTVPVYRFPQSRGFPFRATRKQWPQA